MIQRELSAKLGMPSSFIDKVMNGTRPLEITELIDVANIVGLSTSSLISQYLVVDEG